MSKVFNTLTLYFLSALKAQLEKEAMENSKYRELLEQERRDHELAVRLAQESNGQVEDSPPFVRRYRIMLCFHSNLSIWNLLFHFFDTNWRKVERATMDNKQILIK